MNAKKHFAVLLGTASLLAGGVAAAPAANAATSCYGSTCNGLDPANTICQNDARTVSDGFSGRVELRYSPTCRAAWARFPYGMPANSTLVIENSSGKKYSKTGSGSFYTKMVNDKDITAWACGYWDEYGSRNWECTTSY